MSNKISVIISNYFSRGHERSLKAKKNIFALFLIKGVSILVNLALVPMTIHYVDPKRYGIWLTLSAIIAWFGFFDIGFGNGLRNKCTEALAKGNKHLVRTYISTTYAILTLIVFFLWIVFYIANHFINWCVVLNAPAGMIKELNTLAIIVFTFFCLQFILKLISVVITSTQQPAKASVFDMMGQILALGIIYILTKISSGSLILLGLTFSAAPVFVLLVATIYFYKNEFKEFTPSVSHIKFAYGKDLMQMGVKFFIIQIAAIILYQTSSIIIIQLFGPENVTVYNVSYRYFSIITLLFNIVMMPFWTAFTDAYAKHDLSWMKNIIKKLQYIWIILLVLIFLMLVFSNIAYRFWIGDAVKVRWSISLVMAIYVIINIWNTLYGQILNGIGKIKLLVYNSFFACLINIPLAILLGKKIGIEGVILSSIIFGIIATILTPLQLKLILNNKAKGIWNK